MPTNFTQPGAAGVTISRWLYLMAAAAILLELFWPAARPAVAGLITEPWDKVAHIVVYSTLTGFLWAACGGRSALIVVAGAVLLGALDELHQAGIPGRTADAMDFLADTFAVTATIGVLSMFNAKGQSCAA